MKWPGFLLLWLLLAMPAHAQQDTLFNYERLVLQTSIANQIRVLPSGGSPYVAWLSANVSWYPLNDTRQEVLDFSTTPDGVMHGDTIEFIWEEPTDLNLAYSIDAKVQTSGVPIPLENRIAFPLGTLERSYSAYVQPQDIIDITPEIRTLAQELAQGKTDLFEVVFALAQWTKQNIAYNLTTLNVEASQSASWVLENRQGVCDELTSLFIAMARSLGIPARFVAGVSYTDMEQFDNPWGAHGWAEVYFPGTGWIPFDVTYGQYGFVDATHIKLKEALDAKQATVRYTSRGRNIDLDTSQYQITTKVVERGNLLAPDVKSRLEVLYERIGAGSFNLVTVTMQNNEPHYLAFDLQIAQTKGLQYLDDLRRSVVLKPDGTATISWVVQQTGSLEPGYLYTFPVEIHVQGQVLKSEFTAKNGGIRYSHQDVLEHRPTVGVALIKPQLICSSSKPAVFPGMEFGVSCKAPGSDKVCHERNCLNPVDGEANFTLMLNETGVHTLMFVRQGLRSSTASYVTIDVQLEPDVYIEDLTAPDEVTYDGSGAIEFIVRPAPNSEPRKLVILVSNSEQHQEWTLDVLDSPTQYRLLFDGNALKLGENVFEVRVTFHDQFDKQYVRTESVTVKMTTTLFTQRIMIWFDSLWRRVSGWLG